MVEFALKIVFDPSFVMFRYLGQSFHNMRIKNVYFHSNVLYTGTRRNVLFI